MNQKKQCSCESGLITKSILEYHTENSEMTLADLPIGVTATIVKVMPKMREKKKFADIGMVVGTELLMESHAPFGGLLRIKILETSMAMHRDDAIHIILKKRN